MTSDYSGFGIMLHFNSVPDEDVMFIYENNDFSTIPNLNEAFVNTHMAHGTANLSAENPCRSHLG